MTFPAGLLSYGVRGVAVGATIQVDVILPAGSSPDSTVKYIDGSYVTFPGGLITGNVVSLTLQTAMRSMPIVPRTVSSSIRSVSASPPH